MMQAWMRLMPVITEGSYRNMPRNLRKLLGRHIVVDPEICHGKPTFVGTRIMVAQVLKQVAKGMSWDAITAEWRGTVTKEAIAEAVELAQRAFEDHAWISEKSEVARRDDEAADQEHQRNEAA